MHIETPCNLLHGVFGIKNYTKFCLKSMDNDFLRRLPLDQETIIFHGWTISYEKSHILKSVCTKGPDANCSKDDINCCELCSFQNELDLPHLPDMVFYKNKLSLCHSGGARIEFKPIDALRLIDNGKQHLEISCAQEWRETRSATTREEKFKPFDWTFTAPYQGTMNDKFHIESCDQTLNKYKLMMRENILFYHDLTLFEDELHDNGISSLTRVMPSGFFILLRHFLRVDNVIIKIHDTRFHFEVEHDYIFKEFTQREASYSELKHVPTGYYTIPNEIESYLPIKQKKAFKLFFQNVCTN